MPELSTVPAVALLHAGIPLTLLLDLLDPDGPRSDELYAQESQHPDG